MSGVTVGFSCRCGALTGRLTGIDPNEGTHLVCHCADCARASRHFGLPATQAEGVGLFQTTPDRIVIDTGAEHLRVMRLSPKGLMRWYAGCCDTPLANTLTTPGVPFAGILTGRLTDTAALGPVIAHGFVEAADGKSRHRNGGTVVWRVLKRATLARLSGRWRETPFFDIASRRPVSDPVIAPEGTGR